jgi:hypothetical protein
MKFTIRKESFNLLSKKFDEKDCTTIDLEPVIDTVTQAIYERNIRNEAYKLGLEYGYKQAMGEKCCCHKQCCR